MDVRHTTADLRRNYLFIADGHSTVAANAARDVGGRLVALTVWGKPGPPAIPCRWFHLLTWLD
jgi:hypothetical protein